MKEYYFLQSMVIVDFALVNVDFVLVRLVSLKHVNLNI